MSRNFWKDICAPSKCIFTTLKCPPVTLTTESQRWKKDLVDQVLHTYYDTLVTVKKLDNVSDVTNS